MRRPDPSVYTAMTATASCYRDEARGTNVTFLRVAQYKFVITTS